MLQEFRKPCHIWINGELIKSLLIPHGHVDHFGPLNQLKSRFNIPVFIQMGNVANLKNGANNLPNGVGREKIFSLDISNFFNISFI